MVDSHRSPGQSGEHRDAQAVPPIPHSVLGCIGWRLVFLLIGSLILFLGAGGWLALRLHRQHLITLLEEQAVGMGETILSSAHSSMLANDRQELGQIIGNIGQRGRVEALRLVDAVGEVMFSSDSHEVGQVMSPGDASCRGCHSGGTFAPATLREGTSVIRPEGSEGTLRLAAPVLNAPECWQADCHVHPETQRVLGLLDIELSTADLEETMAGARTQMIVFGLVTIALICTVTGVLAWRVVHRPIHELLEGTRRLARGDLAHRLSTNRSGEMGELATSFNNMTARLQEAQQELERWGRTLEDRVAEKSRELEKTHERMIFAEKMVSLGKLAAIVAHEINNPLAGILVSTKLVRRRLAKRFGERPKEMAASGAGGSGGADPGGRATGGGDDIDDSLAMIESETARCGDIVRNLLLFSRRREMTMTAENVNRIVERSLKLVQHQADLQEVATQLELDPGLPHVICDAGQIEQACLAAIMNAIEAMTDGGQLTVRTRHVPATGRARVEVVDSGVGIPEEVRTKVFEPFFTTKSEAKGTGLGLSVLYGIIERHQGRVDFESQPGRGTTFWFELPIVPAPDRSGAESVTSGKVFGKGT